MRETRYCLNCCVTGAMDKHGRCSTCGSSAVVSAERLAPAQIDIYELQKIQPVEAKQ